MMIYPARAGGKQTRPHTITQQLQSVLTSICPLYTSITHHDSPVHNRTGNRRSEQPESARRYCQDRKRTKTGLGSQTKALVVWYSA